MRGLLDIFGTSGGDTLSLLGMSPEAIQRSRDDAQAQALYGLAGSLLSGGPTGLSIVRGLQQGSQAYKNAMQGQVQEQFQGMQVQDLLRKRKQEEEALALQQQARMRQQMVDRAVAGSFQPAQAAAPAQFYGQETQMPLMDDMGQMMPGATAPVAGRAAGIDLQSLAPLLMASPEGRKTLGELMTAQKGLAGETFNLAEGATLGRINPFTNQPEIVAQGAPKEKPTPSDIQGYNLAKSQGFGGSFLDYQTAIKKAGAGSTVVYPPGALVPDKATAKDAQTNILQTGARLSLYNQIEAQFKPEYLQPAFRAGQAWSSIKDRAGKNLPPQDVETLRDFSQFRQNSINNLSQTIKDLTGAAMGVQEAERIMAGMPNAGTGLFDGDSPTEFKAKLDNVTKQMRNVEARNAYILRKGLSFKDVPLDNVPKLINDRASELAREYRVDLKNATPTQLSAIRRQLAVEFGITAD
jgi:hypothetical protein